jgi:hypothetical protein
MSTRQEQYEQDAFNLFDTLVSSWGYSYMQLAGERAIRSLHFAMDVDVTALTPNRLVCRAVYAYSSGCSYWWFCPPAYPEERNRTPSQSWRKVGLSELSVEFNEPKVRSPSGEYAIPDFARVVGSTPEYKDLQLEERFCGDEYSRDLFLPEHHPLLEKGVLHVQLLERWIDLLTLEERIRYGAYARPAPVEVLLYGDAARIYAQAKVSGKSTLRAFTTTPGPHCVFTMGLDCNETQSRVVIAGLDVAKQHFLIYQLHLQGYHFYVETPYRSSSLAKEALMGLRKRALLLLR